MLVVVVRDQAVIGIVSHNVDAPNSLRSTPLDYDYGLRTLIVAIQIIYEHSNHMHGSFTDKFVAGPHLRGNTSTRGE